MYRVLIVEDDKTNLCLYSKMEEWEKCGYVIEGEAHNGAEALDILEKQEFDMLLVDLMMPMMNGLELLEELQKREDTTAKIIVSNYNEFEYVRQGMRLGVIDYLLKPIVGEELLQCLQRVKNKIEEIRKENITEKIFAECGLDVNTGFVRKVMTYFTEHQYLNLGEISEYFQLSKDYFGKLFKIQMHENFNSFVSKYKMEYAKHLLSNSDDKIYEISDRLGYKTTDYFSKIFKDYTGYTPGQYRKEI